MNIKKVSFTNKNNDQLAGRLELPLNRKPHNFAIFAHCFTCTKNLTAVKNVGRALTAQGFGVLRFDFTGLGESEGDFENTNFSGNVDDLIEAASYLEAHYAAPSLLIGHSLGGAAAIFAASRIDSVKAVAVINSPSDPAHLTHLLRDSTSQIRKEGKAKVNLGGIDFTIKKQFLDDLRNKSLFQVVGDFQKALLILHSPQDTVVGINNAEEIYKAARHPKSFVSLDGADHMLSQKKDSQYVGEVIAAWGLRYLPFPKKKKLQTKSQVAASLQDDDGYTTPLVLGDHGLLADEPIKFGGNNFGPSPYEFLSAALAACTVMTVLMYARRKEWPLETVECHIDYSREHAVDCEHCEDDAAKIDTFNRKIHLAGNLTDTRKTRLMEIANKCPVHKTLHSKTQILTTFL